MTIQRRAKKPANYVDVDLTLDSDEEVMPLTTSQSSNKRKRAKESPVEVEGEGSDIPDLEEEEYEVDYIVDSRLRQYGKNSVLEYLIHWKNYKKEDRTWTLAEQFEEDDPPVLAFHKKHPNKARKNQKTVNDWLMGGATKQVPAPAKSITKNGSKSTRAAKAPAPGKENRPSKKARLATRSDDEDFAPPAVDDDSDDEEYEDLASAKSESPAFDIEEDEDPEPTKPAAKAAKKTNGSWGVANKGPKKPAVNLGSFRPKIMPLNIKETGGAAHSANVALPPIHDIGSMFDHMVSRVPSIVDIVKQLNGRKLRVATMCSGTESPLLALNMISNSMREQYDVQLGIDHVFSCEIEPFKQAYIERNFRPPILFRDVTELGRKKAHTAYGSLVDVPGDVDMLIAGTSCVDYSGLNNVKQDIDANGESGRTFRGMLQWVNKHRPAVVLLENVCSAPWDKVVKYFAEINYDANFLRLDTKEFYIPHTRTRVYLYATPTLTGDREHLPEKWMETVKALRRPWSSSFEAFLLPADHPDIHRARVDLAAAKYHNDGSQRKATDWGRCESRHARARQEEELGNLRPLTSWKEAGVCKGLDWTWNDWLQAQTERVVDLLEISTLRMAKEGIDSGYKACIWNVSQNVDRQAASSRTALAQCLTPNMIPWVTNRGGPVTGREALALQGIPVRELLLTSESEDQLADLAGNAMSSTVVGASMIAALQLTVHKLVEGEDAMKAAAEQEAEESARKPAKIVGTGALTPRRLDLAKVDSAPLKDVLIAAERSSRHCECEGQSGTASAPIDECALCGYRACTSCGGRPEHAYRHCDTQRLDPVSFERLLKPLLPMRVKIAGLTNSSLDNVRRNASRQGKGTVTDSVWDLWRNAVVEGVRDAELRFRFLKRQGVWVAVYEAQTAILELWLNPSRPEWRLTIKTPPEEPVSSQLRKLLVRPVARLRLDMQGDNLLNGDWEVCVPSEQHFTVEIIGCGDKVPTWQASLGLQAHSEDRRWSRVEVKIPAEAERALDRRLSGQYTLLPKCGQAQASLHKQEGGDSGNAIFFYLNSDRVGNAADDEYIFTTSIERIDYGTERDVIASLNKRWRETTRASESTTLNVKGGWVFATEAKMTAVKGSDIAIDVTAHADEATFAIPKSAEAVSATTDCDQSVAILSVSVPLESSHAESMWTMGMGSWGQVDLDKEGNTTFANLAWITERLPSLDGFASWNRLSDFKSIGGRACLKCAPHRPTIHWIKQAGKLNKGGKKTKSSVISFEDRKEAGVYEYRLKHRPQPFSVQLRLDNGIGSFRIGFNPSSLAHRALARLPPTDHDDEVVLSWRLVTDHVAELPQPPRVFLLPSNKRDPQHSQPSGFLLPLRKEQLRSLWWMLQQEKPETYTFVEEEISEAVLPALGWRAEGKAERPVMVRGGVIADQVGYGKTIISLALIAETQGEAAPEPESKGLIDLKATLIVVPGHLSKQWPSEIERFAGSKFKTIVIQTMKDLQGLSVSELSKADIIVMASEIFDSEVYWQRFEYLSAQPEGWLEDPQGSRFFAERLDTAMSTLRQQTETLKSDGAEAAAELMNDLHEKARQDAESKRDELRASNFGKRLKGAAYRDKYDASEAPKRGKKPFSANTGPWEVDDDVVEDEVEEDVSMPRPSFHTSKGTESLGSSSVRKNYKLLANPLLHMFRFRRVIADEFTYLEKRPLAAVLRLSSCFKWVLSGTPPVDDFSSIRTIATFMGIHLGVQDDAEGSTQAKKARAKEQTEAEKFHAFRETHSAAWHRRRDDLAQQFLNTFVRQNIAEIDDIPTVEHIHSIRLPASEGAVYLELEHHLQALEMQARKETKFKNVTVGDRNARLEEALADSKTAEEALLKRCCHFTLDLTDRKFDAKTAQEACEHIASARRAQLEACEEDLRRTINNAVGLHNFVTKKKGFLPKAQERQPFRDWVEYSFDVAKHDGDLEASERLVAVLQERCNFDDGIIPNAPADGKAPKIEAKATVEDVKWELREQTHLLRRLAKELVGRVRSLRFFEVVRNLQLRGDEATAVLEGSECGHHRSDDKMAILSCCGHVACHDCMVDAVNNQKCVKPAACHAAVRPTNIVKVSTLGIEGELSSGRYGAKLQRLVDLIHSIPKRERVLVFLQWDDLMKKVSEALDAGGISHVTLAGGVKAKANTLDRFQSGTSSARVLVLKMNDASAAGSNLTMANHAIFIGPLFTPSLLNYRSTETQAIGRVRRFGQDKEVHIHRLLVQDTIDYTIFDARTKELKDKPDYIQLPRGRYVPSTKKKSRQTQDAVEELL